MDNTVLDFANVKSKFFSSLLDNMSAYKRNTYTIHITYTHTYIIHKCMYTLIL